MIGVVICTHSSLCKGMKAAVEMIIGEQDNFEAIDFNPGDDLFELSKTINSTVKNMGTDKTIIFTDLFGASPTNAAGLSLVELDATIITGVNLGMVIESIISRNQSLSQDDFLEHLVCSGKEGIRQITKKDIIPNWEEEKK